MTIKRYAQIKPGESFRDVYNRVFTKTEDGSAKLSACFVQPKTPIVFHDTTPVYEFPNCKEA